MTSSPERFEGARRLLDSNVAALVRNEVVVPEWIDGAAFWYRRQTPNGHCHVLVDASGDMDAAFDHEAVAEAVSQAAATSLTPDRLDVEAIALDGSVTLRAAGTHWRYDARAAIVRQCEAGTAPPDQARSPSGDVALVTRGDNVALLDLGTGEESWLTTDGEPGFAWGKLPDSWLTAAQEVRPRPPFGWQWSPGGHRIVGSRVDERHIAPYPFVEPAPRDGAARPRIHWVRQALVGEPGPVLSCVAIDAASGARSEIRLPDEVRHAITCLDPLAWSPDESRFWIAVILYAQREARLIEIDATSGECRTVVRESTEGFINLNPLLYNAHNVRIIDEGRQAIWYSERSGWGHLYRYDLATGALLNPITSGEWPVRDIVGIDAARERIFFTSGAATGDPYCRRLHRVNFDGSQLTLLTREPGDHDFEGTPATLFAYLHGTPQPPALLSPDRSRFVDSFSTVTAPGLTLLRSTEDGRVLAELERADAAPLFQLGWQPPEPFTVKAADGETELRGVLYWPPHRQGPLPVVDMVYGGPQLSVVPHNFRSARHFSRGGYGRAALASLGFAVIVLDGRGTPLRSKNFHDHGYGNFADRAIEDHVAALQQLLERFPEFDGERVGIMGHSFGGYIAARALLRRPDIYRVGVSSAGPQNLHGLYADVGMYLPPPDYGGGEQRRPVPDAVPENYRELDNAPLAANLSGKLLLAYGDLDENVFPAVTFQFIKALVAAGRNYDLLCLPNRTHHFKSEPYFLERAWDYLLAHLRPSRPRCD